MPIFKNRPLPEGHPLKGGLILFGQKRAGQSEKPSEANSTSKSPDDLEQNAFQDYEKRVQQLRQDMVGCGDESAVSADLLLRRQRSIQDCKILLVSEDADSFTPQSAQEQQDEELVAAFLAKQLESTEKPQGFDLKNYKSGAKYSAIPLANYNNPDPMLPAAEAMDRQIKQWVVEAMVKANEAEPAFRPQSAQDKVNEELETGFYAKQFQKKAFEIRVQKGEQGLAKSPTQAWRNSDTPGSKEDRDS